jgi:hypothetical protein
MPPTQSRRCPQPALLDPNPQFRASNNWHAGMRESPRPPAKVAPLEIRAPHFTVVEWGEKNSREVALRFEQVRAAFSQ